jgi:hypothetical protein
MRLVVLDPNATPYWMEVHKAGCADLSKGPRGRAKAQGAWTVEADTLTEAAEDIAGDFLAEGSMTVDEAIDEHIHWSPCMAHLPRTSAPTIPTNTNTTTKETTTMSNTTDTTTPEDTTNVTPIADAPKARRRRSTKVTGATPVPARRSRKAAAPKVEPTPEPTPEVEATRSAPQRLEEGSKDLDKLSAALTKALGTDKEVPAMLALRQAGASYSQIATVLGVVPMTARGRVLKAQAQSRRAQWDSAIREGARG